MNLASIAIRGSSGLQPEVETFISASYANITDAGIITDLNNLVTSLKNNGLWTLLKAVYPIVGGNANAHSYNLKDVTQYQITWSGGLTHDANGVTGNGTTGYGNTGLVPSTSGLTQNSTHLSFYARTMDGYSTKRDMRVTDGTRNTGAFVSGLYIYSEINTNNQGGGAAVSGAGHVCCSRTGSSSGVIYKNGSNVGSPGNVSTGLPTLPIAIMANNNNGTITNFSDRNYAFFSVGSGLNSIQAGNLYSAVQAFQTARGRQV